MQVLGAVPAGDVDELERAALIICLGERFRRSDRLLVHRVFNAVLPEGKELLDVLGGNLEVNDGRDRCHKGWELNSIHITNDMNGVSLRAGARPEA